MNKGLEKSDENTPWWKRAINKVKNLAKKGVKTGMAEFRLSKHRAVKVGNISYGTIRDLMFDHGVLDAFGNRQIINTIGTASRIIGSFKELGILHKAPDVKNPNGLHDLMFHYFMHRKIAGYDWEKNAYHDTASQAGFAQSFLEYIKYKILPQWNLVESLLSHDITNTTA